MALGPETESAFVFVAFVVCKKGISVKHGPGMGHFVQQGLDQAFVGAVVLKIEGNIDFLTIIIFPDLGHSIQLFTLTVDEVFFTNNAAVVGQLAHEVVGAEACEDVVQAFFHIIGIDWEGFPLLALAFSRGFS